MESLYKYIFDAFVGVKQNLPVVENLGSVRLICKTKGKLFGQIN